MLLKRAEIKTVLLIKAWRLGLAFRMAEKPLMIMREQLEKEKSCTIPAMIKYFGDALLVTMRGDRYGNSDQTGMLKLNFPGVGSMIGSGGTTILVKAVKHLIQPEP